MNRSIIFCIAIALGTVVSTSAWAEDPAPTKEQLEAAKKAFGEGKALFDEKKFAEAVEKFKESYRLSRNPLLLYNIGFTLDQAGQRDKALFYYRKFLADAPQNAAQRKEVQKRVEVIEKENLEADLNGTSTTPANATTPGAPTQEPKKEIKIKPAGTYSEKDFQHILVEAAPPGKPLDITAVVPEDSGFVVTLYYRGSGDAKFNAKPMKRRYNELVGRIPANKVYGSSIQYYIEAKDTAGTAIAKSGKSTSPNLVNIEQGATPRFYPDLTDEGEQAMTAAQQKKHDEEDPILGKSSKQEVDTEGDAGKKSEEGPIEPTTPGNGFKDVGSSKFEKAKWISTGAAGVFIGGAVASFFLARKQAANLEADSTSCGQPPCRAFDKDYDLAVQDAGKRYNTIHKVTTVFGVAAAGVAAYFWYRELTAKKRGELKVTNKNNNPETTWAITPSLSEGFAGAAATVGF